MYNGGPGSSTMWLRMGSFGPVRVATGDNGNLTGPPPYRLVVNRYTLLDTSDLVFIDMPGSGFGRIIGSGTRDEFWGITRMRMPSLSSSSGISRSSDDGTRRVFFRRIVRHDAHVGAFQSAARCQA